MGDRFDEIAKGIALQCYTDEVADPVDWTDRIASALRKAVEDEREECAKVALNTEVFPMPKNRIVVQTTRQIINRAIRTRSNP